MHLVPDAFVVDFLRWLTTQEGGRHGLRPLGPERFLELAYLYEDAHGREYTPPRQWTKVYSLLTSEPSSKTNYGTIREALDYVGVRSSPSYNSRRSDLLERMCSVSLGAYFLYSPEDLIVSQYVRTHWTSLDALSGDYCDIYVSLAQLLGEESVYDVIDSGRWGRRDRRDESLARGFYHLRVDALPGLFFINRGGDYCFVQLTASTTAELTASLRGLFSNIRKSSSIVDISHQPGGFGPSDSACFRQFER